MGAEPRIDGLVLRAIQRMTLSDSQPGITPVLVQREDVPVNAASECGVTVDRRSTISALDL